MAKTKKPPRRKEAADKGRVQDNASAVPEHAPLPPPHPPRRNVPMLVVSGALLLGWIIYLVIVWQFG